MRPFWPRLIAGGLVALAALMSVAPALAAPGDTTRVSVAGDGTQASGLSRDPKTSADGRYVAFWSSASNLVPDDTNNREDVFVHDRETGTTERVSVATGPSPGNQANHLSTDPSISADGRYVAFVSVASNLVAGDTDGKSDVFVHDRQTDTTQRVSVISGGAQKNGDVATTAISADGRFVGFISNSTNLVAGDTNDSFDVFLHDRQLGTTERVSVASDETQGNSVSFSPSISADGRYVAFSSSATNLDPGGTDGGFQDVLVRDRQTGTTARVNIATDGSPGNEGALRPSISADGRYVAFISADTNLVADDTNDGDDVFVHDRQTATTERVSVATDGTQGNNFSEAGDFSTASISADGRYVVFSSEATNLVAGDTNGSYDVFVHDRQLRTTQRVNIGAGGTQGNNTDVFVRTAISADGSFVAFDSNASNLVTGDTNGVVDIFVHEPAAVAVVQHALSVSKAGTGSGTVTSSPAGISCGADCTESYNDGTLVTLTASPAAGSAFTGWSGSGCSGTGSCILEMDADNSVSATFTANPDTTPPGTEITSGPPKSTRKTKATLKFAGTDNVTAPAGLEFECKLDGKPFKPCDSPKTYARLKLGRHTFQVRATDASGNTDRTPAKKRWKVVDRP